MFGSRCLLCVAGILGAANVGFGALSDNVPRSKRGNARAQVYRHKPRVRREWRTLSLDMRAKVARAMWIVKNLTTEEGQNRYGPRFHNHDDILLAHACATLDPRCDQGHFGPQFMTFHRLLLLKYELAIMSVDPAIEALPYWNMAFDAVGGKYHEDADTYIFSPHFFGTRNGTVDDGLFANWPVVEYSKSRFGGDSTLARQDGKYRRCIAEEWFVPQPCNCGEASCPTYLRLVEHAHCNPSVTRWNQDPAQGGQIMHAASGENLNPQGQGGSWDLVYTEAEFNLCADPRHTPTWMEWQNCIEFGAGECFRPGSEEHRLRTFVLRRLMQHSASANEMREHAPVDLITILDQLAGKLPPNCTDTMLVGYFRTFRPNGTSDHRGRVNYLHSQVHSKIGLDMLDVTTSPNDVGPFMGHHGNIDRNNFHWMHAAKEQVENANWTYPSSQSMDMVERLAGPKPYGMSGPFSIAAQQQCGNQPWATQYTGTTPWLPGSLLDDVVNEGFPFFSLFDDCDGGTRGYTHKDVLILTAPHRTPYTYDTLEHLYYPRV